MISEKIYTYRYIFQIYILDINFKYKLNNYFVIIIFFFKFINLNYFYNIAFYFYLLIFFNTIII